MWTLSAAPKTCSELHKPWCPRQDSNLLATRITGQVRASGWTRIPPWMARKWLLTGGRFTPRNQLSHDEQHDPRHQRDQDDAERAD